MRRSGPCGQGWELAGQADGEFGGESGDGKLPMMIGKIGDRAGAGPNCAGDEVRSERVAEPGRSAVEVGVYEEGSMMEPPTPAPGDGVSGDFGSVGDPEIAAVASFDGDSESVEGPDERLEEMIEIEGLIGRKNVAEVKVAGAVEDGPTTRDASMKGDAIPVGGGGINFAPEVLVFSDHDSIRSLPEAPAFGDGTVEEGGLEGEGGSGGKAAEGITVHELVNSRRNSRNGE